MYTKSTLQENSKQNQIFFCVTRLSVSRMDTDKLHKSKRLTLRTYAQTKMNDVLANNIY